MTSADLVALIKKQPVASGALIVCIALGGVLYFRSSQIDTDQADYDEKAAHAAKIISNVSAAKNLPEQVQEIQAATKELESRLVRGGQLAINLQYFYKLEAETNVKLIDVRPNAVPKSNGTAYVGIPFSVTVQGSFNQVMLFLNRLENGRHFCRITNTNFNRSSAGGADAVQNGMIVSLNLDLLGQP